MKRVLYIVWWLLICFLIAWGLASHQQAQAIHKFPDGAVYLMPEEAERIDKALEELTKLREIIKHGTNCEKGIIKA